MSLIHRPLRAALIAVLGLAMSAMTGAFATSALASATSAAPRFVALSGSATTTHDSVAGSYSNSRMSVEVALAPRDPAGLNALLQAQYTKGGGQYQDWLARGQFDARFAPAAATRAAVDRYLAQQGLTVTASASPFLVRAVGTSAQVSAAFQTTLRTYSGTRGTRFFANATAVRLPATLAPGVLGVIGLTNTVRPRDMVVPTKPASRSGGHGAVGLGQLRDRVSHPVRAGRPVRQRRRLPEWLRRRARLRRPDAVADQLPLRRPDAGARGKGKGVNLAVFELSAYLPSDIDTWAHTVYGKSFTPPLKNVIVDGGPLNPKCPAGDTCPASFEGYAGDIEVDADIEQQLTIAPDASHIIVYNAPNDETGQTELDEYTQDRQRRHRVRRSAPAGASARPPTARPWPRPRTWSSSRWRRRGRACSRRRATTARSTASARPTRTSASPSTTPSRSPG